MDFVSRKLNEIDWTWLLYEIVVKGVLFDYVTYYYKQWIIICGSINGLEDLGIAKFISIGLLPSIAYFELKTEES